MNQGAETRLRVHSGVSCDRLMLICDDWIVCAEREAEDPPTDSLQGTVFLEKPVITEIVEGFPAFHGNWRIIALFTRGLHLSLSWASLILCTRRITHFNIIVCSTHRSSPCIVPQLKCSIFISQLHCVLHARVYLTVSYFFILIVFGDTCRLLGSSLCRYVCLSVRSAVTS
jgi:hypothetical protein